MLKFLVLILSVCVIVHTSCHENKKSGKDLDVSQAEADVKNWSSKPINSLAFWRQVDSTMPITKETRRRIGKIRRDCIAKNRKHKRLESESFLTLNQLETAILDSISSILTKEQTEQFLSIYKQYQ